MISDKIKRQLDAIDWDFPSSKKGVSKSSHWYPGTFPSQLPSAFIQSLSQPDELVFDPYGGIGTTAIESIRLNRKAWVVDINPVAVLSCYVQTSLLLLKINSSKKFDIFINFVDEKILDDDLDLFDQVNESTIIELKKIEEEISNLVDPKPDEMRREIRKSDNINNIQLENWVHESTLLDLNSIFDRLTDSFDGKFYKIFIDYMFSSNLRALSSQNKSWGHIADNCFPKEYVRKNTKSLLRSWLRKLITSIRQVDHHKNRIKGEIQFWCSLHNWNLSSYPQHKPERKAKVLITSPPYGDAIDYIFSQKLSLYFLGYENAHIHEICENEIGARRKRFRPTSKADWAEQLSDSTVKQLQYVNGVAVNVLPHKDHGREIGLQKIVEKLETIGWNTIFSTDRSISQKKTRQSWTSIKQETITVFARK